VSPILGNNRPIFLGTVPVTRAYKGSTLILDFVPAASITITPTSSMESMALQHASNFRTWLGGGRQGFIGEFGVPNDRPAAEQNQWNAMQDKMLHKLNADKIGWTFWATGHLWGAGYNVSYYENNGNPGGPWVVEDSASTMETHYQDPVPFTGGNYAGHEFFNGSTAPTQSDWQFHYNRGMRHARYAIGPAFIYPTAGGPLDPGNLTHIVDMLDRAHAVGIKVILDVLHPGNGGQYAQMFGVSLTNPVAVANYQDYITKLHAAIGTKPALWGYDIANEPATVTPAQWEGISQTLYTWYRTTLGWSGNLAVPIGSFSGAHSVASFHPNGPWIQTNGYDANLYYTAHYYPNRIGQFGSYDGTFNNPDTTVASFDDNIASATAAGFAGGTFTYTPRTTEAPSAPTAPALASNTHSQVTLGWTAVAGATGYIIYRDGNQILDTSSTSTTIAGLTPETAYLFSIRAYNVSWNLSPFSPNLSVTTDVAPVSSGNIEFDSATTRTTSYVNNYTFTHTASGVNRYALVFIAIRTDSITSVTYGGSAMTLLQTSINTNVSGGQIWGISAPATGPQTVSVSLSGFVLSNAAALSFTGVSQTTSIDAVTGVPSGFGATASTPITTTVDNAHIVHAFLSKENRALTTTSGTVRADIGNPDANLGSLAVADLVRGTAGAGNVAWTADLSDNFSTIAVALTPA
jgi:hypothetical protein